MSSDKSESKEQSELKEKIIEKLSKLSEEDFQQLSDEKKIEKLIDLKFKIFHIAIDHFRSDVREFFIRSNFYLVIEAALLTVLFTRRIPNETSNSFYFFISIGIIASGLIFSYFWWRVAVGSVKWIDRLRDKIIELSEFSSILKAYSNVEKNAKIYPFQSAERVTQYLGLIFIFFWSILAVVYTHQFYRSF